jgi:hypothetical protein
MPVFYRFLEELGVTGRQVVGKDSSKTNVKREVLVGLDVDHRQICDMKSAYSGISKVAAFIDSTLVAAQTQNGCNSEGIEFKISIPNILTPSRYFKFLLATFPMSYQFLEYTQWCIPDYRGRAK